MKKTDYNNLKRKKMITIQKFLILITIGFVIALAPKCYAQNTYLKITLNDKDHESVSFPPETKFELLNKNGKVVYNDQDTLKIFKISEFHKLIVYPSWKKSTDTFEITNGKIEQVSTSVFFPKSESEKKLKHNKKNHTNGLSLTKQLIPSTENEGKYNVIFRFSNGIVATYTDGEFTATLNDESLRIREKYFIYFKGGIIKLSFNASNGVTWWVYEPK